MGTSIGRDFFERVFLGGRHSRYTVAITRIGIVFGVLVTVTLGYKLPGSIIAIATAIFFGLCATTFLPAYVGALFWKGMTKTGAVSSMLVGFFGNAFWLLFIHQKPTLVEFPWTVVDPIVVMLPVSLLVGILVSLFTRKMPSDHINHCFKHI
jgi:SSS family solute:Na+ symporter